MNNFVRSSDPNHDTISKQQDSWNKMCFLFKRRLLIGYMHKNIFIYEIYNNKTHTLVEPCRLVRSLIIDAAPCILTWDQIHVTVLVTDETMCVLDVGALENWNKITAYILMPFLIKHIIL